MSSDIARLADGFFDVPGDIPAKAKAVLALRAFGMESSEIAKAVGDEKLVKKFLKAYNRDHFVERADSIRRLVLSSLFDRMAFEVMTNITKEELDELPVKDRMKVVTDCIKSKEALSARPLAIPKDEQDVLEALR